VARMKLVSLAADARKKKLRDQEVFDYIALGLKIVLAMGRPIGSSMRANFDCVTESRVSVTITADHEEARLNFRWGCLSGLQVVNSNYVADHIHGSVLDELAKLIVVESSTFV
jgi:hypothetical protein